MIYTEVKMTKFGGFISLIGGAATLIGYFIKSLNDQYPFLIWAGGVVAVVGALISLKNTKKTH